MSFERRLLEAFVMIADRGSVGRAAMALNSTQPTVSRQLHALEGQRAQPLFDRTAKGMALTAAGAELLPRAKLLLHEMKLAAEAMDALNGLRRGVVRIGAVAAVARNVLPDVLSRIHRAQPELGLSLIEGSEDQLELALERREVDVIFTTHRPRELPVVSIGGPPIEDRCIPFCSTEHPPIADDRPVTLADLMQLCWAMPHRGATPRDHFESLVHAQGLELPRIAFESNSADAIVRIVAQSPIVGWLPLPMMHRAVLTGQIRLLDVPQLEWRRRFQGYRRAQGTFPKAAQAFITALASHSESTQASASLDSRTAG